MARYTGYDFCGWATRNDIRCSDGRTIKRDAFAHQDGMKVPLVWGHNHESPEMVLGHGFLENRPEGVFFYGYFNDSELAQSAKKDVAHGDITSLSIWANQLKQQAGNVLHGSIKEVSLVLAGANKEATITYPVVAHGDGFETLTDEAYIALGDGYGLELAHAVTDADDETEGEKIMEKDKIIQDVLDEMTDEQLQVVSYLVGKAATEGTEEQPEETKAEKSDEKEDKGGKKELTHADEQEEKTVQDVLDEMTEEQLNVMYYLIGKAVEDAKANVKHSDMEETTMNFNAFDTAAVSDRNYLSHEDTKSILTRARKLGKLSDALAEYAEENQLAHADDDPVAVEPRDVSGFTSYPNGATPAGVDALFPEYHDVYPGAPQLIYNDQAWVKTVLGKVNKTPFSRIRTNYVDIRNLDELRARGYAKGKEKELAGNYAVAKRATDPQTVYVKSALNHDDIVDITDFDYVDYQYKIDRMQLELELARAILIGDGRDVGDEGKISEEHIRPIWKDNSVYTIHKTLTLAANANGTNTAANFGENYRYAEAMIETLLDARIDFKGTGAQDMFCTQQFFNKLMLAKDMNGRRIYSNKGELTSALDVNNVYTVPEFANKTRTENGHTYKLLAIVGNLGDYSLGQTKGGEIIHRTQFDIDFNQEKSLLETRVSGATTKLYSFIVIEEQTA